MSPVTTQPIQCGTPERLGAGASGLAVGIAPLDGVVLGGRFRVERHHRSGGMADVYRGWDLQLGSPVALKVLTQPDASPWFLEEARLLASIREPHLVQVLASGETERGTPFIALEWLGASLGERLAGGPLPWREVSHLASQVAGALAALHQRGIIHRDVKPDNILQLETGRSVKLIDLGIARVLERPKTRPGALMGTAGFLPPDANPADASFDSFALGVTIYLLCTQTMPVAGAWRPMRQVVPHAGIPSEFDLLVEQSLARREVLTAEEFGRRLKSLAQRGESHRFDGNFELLEPLGTGRTGEVFRAVHHDTRSVVALKILSSRAADSEDRRRFAREALVLGTLRHPALPALLGSRTVAEPQYIAVGLVTGTRASEFCLAGQTLSPIEVLQVGTQLASALVMLHTHGVLHRDIHPANVLIERRPGEIRATLIDLGMVWLTPRWYARAKSRYLTPPEHRDNWGTGGLELLDWTAPEARVTRQWSEKCDVFSLGLLLYRLLTGKRPFVEGTEFLPPDVGSRAITAALRSALRHDPQNRCDASELLEELAGAQEELEAEFDEGAEEAEEAELDEASGHLRSSDGSGREEQMRPSSHLRRPRRQLPRPRRQRTAAVPQPNSELAAQMRAAEEADLPSLRDTMVLGEYELLSILGEGGSARVWRAKHRKLGLERALKVYDRPRPDARERVRREAAVLAALKHPAIVTIYDCFETEDTMCIVMELVQGSTLEEIFSGPIDVGEVIRIGCGVCAALEAAHAKGVFHRDLTPANIMLGDGGEVTVVDWGLSYSIQPATGFATPASAILGSPEFCAPELQRRSGRPPPNARTDVYALGVVLLGLLHGGSCIPKNEREPKLPLEMVGTALGEVLSCSVHADPRKRPQTAAAFGEALALAACSLPSHKRPTATPEAPAISGSEMVGTSQQRPQTMAVGGALAAADPSPPSILPLPTAPPAGGDRGGAGQHGPSTEDPASIPRPTVGEALALATCSLPPEAPAISRSEMIGTKPQQRPQTMAVGGALAAAEPSAVGGALAAAEPSPLPLPASPAISASILGPTESSSTASILPLGPAPAGRIEKATVATAAAILPFPFVEQVQPVASVARSTSFAPSVLGMVLGLALGTTGTLVAHRHLTAGVIDSPVRSAPVVDAKIPAPEAPAPEAPAPEAPAPEAPAPPAPEVPAHEGVARVAGEVALTPSGARPRKPTDGRQKFSRQLKLAQEQVQACIRRHGGFGATALAVRVAIADGRALLVELPGHETSTLASCVTSALQQQNYPSGSGGLRWVRHVFEVQR